MLYRRLPLLLFENTGTIKFPMTETTGTAKNQNDAVSRVTKNETNASNENIMSIIIDRIGPLFACSISLSTAYSLTCLRIIQLMNIRMGQ